MHVYTWLISQRFRASPHSLRFLGKARFRGYLVPFESIGSQQEVATMDVLASRDQVGSPVTPQGLWLVYLQCLGHPHLCVCVFSSGGFKGFKKAKRKRPMPPSPHVDTCPVFLRAQVDPMKAAERPARGLQVSLVISAQVEIERTDGKNSTHSTVSGKCLCSLARNPES